MTLRLKPDDRKKQILDAALHLAERDGYTHVTREAVAAAANCAPALISSYFGTMPSFKRDIMRAAVRERRLRIVAQGLAAADPHARKAPDDVKAAALSAIAA